ncbi:MAG: type II toxin-antitoxin system ParD family antitoxin [Minwuia sp.]|nr:type II toxin-antitoxin system ParD family antitoxin [Minwuia sp.]
MFDAITRQLRAKVEAGEYGSTSEVLRTAVRSWLKHEEEYETRLAAIRARIHASLDDPHPPLTAGEMRRGLDALHAAHEDAVEWSASTSLARRPRGRTSAASLNSFYSAASPSGSMRAACNAFRFAPSMS